MEDQVYVKCIRIKFADAYYFIGDYLTDNSNSNMTFGKFTEGLKVKVQYPQRLYLTVVANSYIMYAQF